MTTIPTLPPRPANARPFLWGANDARIAARIDEAATARTTAALEAELAVDVDPLAMALAMALAAPTDEQLAAAVAR